MVKTRPRFLKSKEPVPISETVPTMVVVGHAAKGVDRQGARLDLLHQDREETRAIRILQKRGHARHAPRDEVVDRSRKFDAQGTTHAATIASEAPFVKS